VNGLRFFEMGLCLILDFRGASLASSAVVRFSASAARTWSSHFSRSSSSWCRSSASLSCSFSAASLAALCSARASRNRLNSAATSFGLVRIANKQMEFAREIVPGATRIGLLTNLEDQKARPQRQELVSAAKALELTIVEADTNKAALSRLQAIQLTLTR
jgi:hypothetical protein